MIEFIVPLYNWLQQFTNHDGTLSSSSDWHSAGTILTSNWTELNWTELNWTELNWTGQWWVSELCYDRWSVDPSVLE
jgi:hypothetical protein